MTKEKVFKILKIAGISILAIILITLLVILIKKIIKKEDIPFITAKNAYVVLSGSMEPEIKVGDIVFMKEVKQEDLNVGDIISFNSGEMLVTHRITEIKDEDGVIEYITKGDNNNTEDIVPVTYDQIVGKYGTKIAKLGYVVLFIQEHLVLVIGCFVFIAAYIILNPKNRVKKEEKKVEENSNKN